MNCEYCNKQYDSKKAFGAHIRSCPQNPNRIIMGNAKNKLMGIRSKMFDDPEYKQRQRENQLGRKHSEETKAKLSKITTDFFSISENRNMQSLLMQKAVVENPDSYLKKNVVGRVKNISYNGVILKGSWEVAVATALDELCISWVQPDTGIPYNWKTGIHLYFPDFYLPDFDVFLEVKGYQTERDECKWVAVSNLLVFKEKEIKDIQKGNISWILERLLSKK